MSVSSAERELGTRFLPRFDASGLLTAIAVDSASREILMVAFMDAEALDKTRASGLAHFHSRSRGRLWLKVRLRAISCVCRKSESIAIKMR